MPTHKSALLTTITFVVVVTFFSIISIRNYTYPISDQEIQIPILDSLLNPDLFENDYLQGKSESHPSAYWMLLSTTIQLTQLDRHVVFFIFYAIATFALFMGTYHLSLVLFDNHNVAILAVFILLFTQIYFAGISVITTGLTFRTIAIPLMIFGFHAFFSQRFILAYGLIGLTFLIHPLTGVFVIAMVGLASLIHYRKIGIKRLFLACVIFAVISSPVFYIQFASSSGSTLIASAEWLDLMYLRSSFHLFPSTWEPIEVIHGALTFVVLAICLKHKPQNNFQYRTLQVFIVTTLLLIAGGIVFSTVIPVKILIQLQLLRSATVMFYFVPLLYANYFHKELEKPSGVIQIIGLILLAGFAFGVFLFAPSIKEDVGYIVFIFVTIGWQSYPYAKRKISALALPVGWEQSLFAVMITGAIVATGIISYRVDNKFTIDNQDEPDWVDVQKWAKQNTDIDAVFIVPIYREGFRIDSQRTIYTTWKDGTMAFFDEAIGFEWFKRIQSFGFEPEYEGEHIKSLSFAQAKEILTPIYVSLDTDTVLDIASTIDSCDIYFVSDTDSQPLTFAIRYANNTHTVYSVSKCDSQSFKS